MIGGTSTGGLIAMMLGRMKMSVDDCIEAYIELSDQVFRKKRFLPLRMTGKVQGRFDSKVLEDAVKTYLRERNFSEDCLLQDVEPKSCKVFQEAREAFLEPGEQLEDHVNCVVSIGTGVPSIEPFGHDLKTIAKTIAAMSTQTEETAKNFRRNHENLKESGRYFRFNVSHGLERIGLEWTDRKNDIINITKPYLEEDETDELLRKRGTNELLKSISAYDHETRLKSISARVMPGTTKWILSNGVFVSWEGNKHLIFLLCTGIIGSGKTMLASSAVEELVLKHDGSEEVIAHYFIDARHPEELSTTELLRGII
ncbi:hypothetical protein GRF29_112g1348125 [Pseudopithomyces chartarum]|uniref:Nephrocystin 3-like N-terminal domain-containing protein n=1 Tax=Pseudopithomyces chartarum TaxID=1892770 RepID=A0AAN6LSH5_9PLEO|nr:hypothetical protein GRF29_112g1348125 [Pseudopithomyces chartarum]